MDPLIAKGVNLKPSKTSLPSMSQLFMRNKHMIELLKKLGAKK